MVITLPSNMGNYALSIDLSSKSDRFDDSGYESSITLSSRFWDEDHTYPICLKFDGLWLKKSNLEDVRQHLTNWVNQPLSELAASVLTGEFELAALPGESLVLHFGPRKDVIDGRNPVVTVKLKVATFNTGFHFVTDQSCLRQFADELSRI